MNELLQENPKRLNIIDKIYLFLIVLAIMISSFAHEIEHNPVPEDVGIIKISVATTKIYQSIISNYDLYDELTSEFSCIPVSLRDCVAVELTEFLTGSGKITPIDAYHVLLELFRFVDEITSSDDYTPGCALRVLMTLTIAIPPEHIEEDVLGLEDEQDVYGEASSSQFEEVVPFYGLPYFRDDYNDYFPYEEASSSQLGEVVLFHGLPHLRDEHHASFGFDHQIEEASHSQIEEVFQVSFNETNTVRLKPASKLTVGALNRKTYKKASGVVCENDVCTICLEEFDDGRSIVTLPCGHEFDEECVLEWFVRSHVCPLCRLELPCER
ncbi:putative transcription factor C2H2 family [Arabidopsis thaliana]|uniref:RING-type domain-containing protein n=3 Tax=Arabidopsis TaxID=3701 RepID=A0A178W4T3_ARATH|nr:Zinc finger RING-type [Arabidopsis thaliana x Arabidopsis arenosa]KAG7654781.1 Zinc finger RING-type [Arabidopsis suecica]OAP12691.1 hypothetical protein AXX17_AT1G19730 [Arabidopsis thaliana]